MPSMQHEVLTKMIAEKELGKTVHYRYVFAFLVGSLLACSVEALGQPSYDTIALTGATGVSRGQGPGAGSGNTYSSFLTPYIAPSGDVSFMGLVAGPGISPLVDGWGIWTDTGTSPAIIARNGTSGPPPGIANTSFSGFPIGSLNSRDGGAAFLGVLTGPGVDTSGTATDNSLGVWDAGVGPQPGADCAGGRRSVWPRMGSRHSLLL
jgi:hypothetical protein